MTAGSEWYLHIIYTIKTNNKRVKRHKIERSNDILRQKRSIGKHIESKIGKKHNRGTQMMHIKLDRTSENPKENSPINKSSFQKETKTVKKASSTTWVLIVVGALVVILVAVVVSIYSRKLLLKANHTKANVAYKSAIVRKPTNDSKKVHRKVNTGKMQTVYMGVEGSEV